MTGKGMCVGSLVDGGLPWLGIDQSEVNVSRAWWGTLPGEDM